MQDWAYVINLYELKFIGTPDSLDSFVCEW